MKKGELLKLVELQHTAIEKALAKLFKAIYSTNAQHGNEAFIEAKILLRDMRDKYDALTKKEEIRDNNDS